jgi:hypothetical protein
MIGKFFREDIHIGERKKEKNGKIYLGNEWRYHNIELSKWLTSIGIPERKSKIDPPYPLIPDEFLNSFARGVLDGDGTIQRGPVWMGSFNFITALREKLILACGVSSLVSTLSHGSIFRVCWNSRNDRKTLYNFLYKDAGNYYLSRKKEAFEGIL